MRELVNSGGFTLIEVMVAAVILTIGSLGIGALTVSIINGNVFSNKMATATVLAHNKLEDIKGLSFEDAARAAIIEDYSAIPDFPSYRRETTVDANAPDPGMIRVTVTVSWWSGSSLRSVVLRTLVAQ